MIEASCHCGAVRMEIDTPPDEVTRCDCTICRKLGVLWAYYAPQQVRLTAARNATLVYLWNRMALEFHTCRTCGCTTHWAHVDRGYHRMAVNARLMEPVVLAAARVHELTDTD